MIKNQVHTFYSGSVQGVGFRYKVRAIANRLNVNGWVRNLPNGQVEIVAQAQESILIEFMNLVESAFNGYISDTQLFWDESDQNMFGFDITF